MTRKKRWKEIQRNSSKGIMYIKLQMPEQAKDDLNTAQGLGGKGAVSAVYVEIVGTWRIMESFSFLFFFFFFLLWGNFPIIHKNHRDN